MARHVTLLSQEKKTKKKGSNTLRNIFCSLFVFCLALFFHSIVPNSTHTQTHSLTHTVEEEKAAYINPALNQMDIDFAF